MHIYTLSTDRGTETAALGPRRPACIYDMITSNIVSYNITYYTMI